MSLTVVFLVIYTFYYSYAIYNNNDYRYGSVEVFNSMGMSPLMQAASLGDPEMVNLMLSAGADVNLTSKGVGRTALMIVCFKGDAKIARQLIERGANWDIRDRSDRLKFRL